MRVRKTGTMAGVVAGLWMFCLVGAVYANGVVIGNSSTDVGTIVFVSPKPDDPALTNGTALLTALAGLTANANKRYLIKLGPGVYNVGSTAVEMKAYIDIEGSGEKVTKITGAIDGLVSPPSSGTIKGADNAELRFLTVENTSTGTAVAILNSSASPSILHVTATVGGGGNSYGVYNYYSSSTMTNMTTTAVGGGTNSYGIYNAFSSPILKNCELSSSGGATNYGIYNYNSSPFLMNVRVTASQYGIYNFGTSGSFPIYVDRCNIWGGTASISNDMAFTTNVGGSMLAGGAVTGGGTLRCVLSYNGNNYSSLSATCL